MEVSFAEDESSDTEVTTIPTFDHNDLFAAAEESILSCRPLVSFFYTNNNNTDEDDNLTITQRRTAITNLVKSPQFNKGRARRLFTAVLPLLTKITEEESYMPDTDTDGNIIQDSHAGSTLSIQYIKCCAILVDAYLEGILLKQKNGRGGLKKMDDEIFEVAELLHDLLFPLQHGPVSSGIKVATQAQSAIFSMCERYWHGNFEDKEQLVTQLIPLLLMKSLNDNAQKNDVKRLYSIREAIDLLDFQDESIESLKLHLLRVVGNPLFLQSVEGRKFITHLFQVDTALVIDLHRAVRAQINGAKKSILNAYADIYYNAWKASTEIVPDDDEEEEEGEIGAIQQSIEENALQDFMYQVIHAAVPSTAKSVRVVLDKFYVNKKNPDVESMLHRMYGPLLWRALSGANSKVRIQASVVLTDTFPLRDPNASVEWTTACVKKSVEALVSLMKDDIPSCRVAGSIATAKILSLFWSAIPSQDIRLLLDQIIGKHTSDASSSAVRAAAVNAVTTLLEEEKSHAVLRPLLSNVGNLIHDKTEKVRLAVVNMLLFVKRLRGIKYYHVVPADHLLSRLADEGLGNNNPTGAVAVGLSNLLSNSFFPTGSKKTMSDIITRTLRLLTDSPQAAVVFYRNAPTQLSVNSISKLIAALMKCLCCFIIEEKKAKFEDVSNLTAVVPEYESIERPNHSSNTAQMATIAESISILWGSIEADLKDAENEGSSEMLDEVFSGNVLTEVYCHFAKFDSDDVEDANECYRACVAILNCAGKIDENKIEGLRVHIVNELSKSNDMPEDELITVNFSPSLSLLCAWGMTEDVAQCLASSIKLYFERGSDEELNTSTKRKSKRTKGKKGKKATNEDGTLPSLKVDVCLNILGHVLKGSYPASAAARTSILESEASFSAISSALLTAKSTAECMIEDPSASQPNLDMIMNISIAIECYGRLLIHRDSMKGDVPIKLSPELKSLMTWATDILSPSLLKLQEDNDNTLKDLDLSDISLISSPISAGPKKKTSGTSPPQLDNIGESSFMSTEADSVNNQVLSVTAISSIIRIFAEWLQLRYTDDSFVSNHFIDLLCKLLESSNDKAVRKPLLPLLINVAGINLRNQVDATLFKTILMSMRKVDISPTEEKIISQSMGSLLSMRDESLLKAAMSTVIHVTRKVVVEASEESAVFTDKVGIFMSKVLEIVLKGKKSSLILAQCLLVEPETSAVRECLLKEIEEHATKTPALSKLLGTANKVETVEEDEDINEKTVVNVDVDKENTANQSEIILAA